MKRAARRGALAAALLAMAAPGCGRETADVPPPAASVTAPAPVAAASVPADHLGPDELVEGKDQAFGVTLPRGVVVEHRYIDTVQVTGPMSVHSLVAYFQPRLRGGSLREGAQAATFEHVSQPGVPDGELVIHIEAGLGKTRVDVTSFHSHPASELPNEAARWRSVGLTPEGKLLDPTHLE